MPRFQTVAKLSAIARPGGCLTCGVTERDRGFVDLGVMIDFEGHLYLCVACAEELGSNIGMVSAGEAGVLRQELADADAFLSEALEKCAEAEERAAVLASALLAVGRAADADLPSETTTVDVEGARKPRAGKAEK